MPFFISHIGQLVLPQPSMTGLPDNPVEVLHNVYLEISDGKIVGIGPEGESLPSNTSGDVDLFDADGMIATPGLIDCHTHPVFAGTRQNEFVRRCLGETYQQIAASGGGILSSIRGVRNASEEELIELLRKRFDRFLALGTTTIEAKSGYGLTLDDELKSLRAIKKAAADHPLDVSPTLLGAHVVPPEYRDNPDRYVDLVCDQLIPQAVEEGLADSVDLFLEKGAYNLSQARRIFQAGRNNGLKLRIHADQFTSCGGAELSAEFGAISADHMDQTDDAGLQALSDAGVTVVLLPGAVFFLGLNHYAPARRMIEAGCRIALSTDFNPGSSPTQSLPLMMTLSCIKMHLTPSEALWAVTLGGAYALGKADKVGTLLSGYDADICLWEAEDVDYIPYNYGDMIPTAVFKKGTLISQ
ncbi:MAG: imidazolonepropionase [Candidatus Electryoneaceae bacterium]|nr:imidazolonepropionase [Candidatus Electryoneaceae bacterium]